MKKFFGLTVISFFIIFLGLYLSSKYLIKKSDGAIYKFLKYKYIFSLEKEFMSINENIDKKTESIKEFLKKDEFINYFENIGNEEIGKLKKESIENSFINYFEEDSLKKFEIIDSNSKNLINDKSSKIAFFKESKLGFTNIDGEYHIIFQLPYSAFASVSNNFVYYKKLKELFTLKESDFYVVYNDKNRIVATNILNDFKIDKKLNTVFLKDTEYIYSDFEFVKKFKIRLLKKKDISKEDLKGVSIDIKRVFFILGMLYTALIAVIFIFINVYKGKEKNNV